MRLLVPLLPLISAFVACLDDRQLSTAIVRDSAGVRIVENTTPLWRESEAWHLSPEPVIDIGGGEAENEQLFGVAGAVRLSDGRIVVANGTQELWFYDDRGVLLAKAGGRGEGPGEFRNISQLIALPGDTLLVRDRWSRTWFDPEGQHVRDALFDAGVFTSQPSLLTYRGQAFAVNVQDQTGPRQMGLSTLTRTWVLLSLDGGGADTIGSFVTGESFTIRIGGRPWRSAPPFGGLRYAPAMGARGLFLGHTKSFEIAVYSYDGELVEIIRRRHAPTPITSDHVTEFRRQFLEGFPPAAQSGAERWLAEVPYPETMPALGRLIVDRRQHLWAQDFAPPGSTSTSWNVFDESGRWLGGVDLPNGAEPREIGGDYVLALWRDADDVEHVQLYDLIKPEQ